LVIKSIKIEKVNLINARPPTTNLLKRAYMGADDQKHFFQVSMKPTFRGIVVYNRIFMLKMPSVAFSAEIFYWKRHFFPLAAVDVKSIFALRS